MLRVEKHSINGKLQGYWYETDAGRKLYLAHRTRSAIYRNKNAWLFDVSLLERCRSRGISAIGVVLRQGKKKLIWLTNVEDFFTSPDAFVYATISRQRGLPLHRFKIDPLKLQENIELSLRIR